MGVIAAVTKQVKSLKS